MKLFPSNKRHWYFTAAAIIAVGVLLWAGYLRFVRGIGWAPWTGFRTKTLWNWFELLIVPMALAVGAWWLNRSERQTEREIAEKQREQDREIAQERRYDATLESYFDRMTALMLDEGLRDSKEGDEVRKIARTRTLAVLRRLDGNHKAEVLQFLYEADLIYIEGPIVSLFGADLSGANLNGAYLRRVDLAGTNLRGSHLCRADLSGAYLERANLQGAHLCGAFLEAASLVQVNLQGADLQAAKLDSASLCEANLQGTNLGRACLHQPYLRRADLRGTDLRQAELAGADLVGADLRRAKLTNQQREYARGQGAILDDDEVDAEAASDD